MEDLEARVRCLELAAQLSKPSGDYSAKSVVVIANELYDFAKAPVPAEKPVQVADKLKRKEKAATPDPFS